MPSQCNRRGPWISSLLIGPVAVLALEMFAAPLAAQDVPAAFLFVKPLPKDFGEKGDGKIYFYLLPEDKPPAPGMHRLNSEEQIRAFLTKAGVVRQPGQAKSKVVPVAFLYVHPEVRYLRVFNMMDIVARLGLTNFQVKLLPDRGAHP